LNLLLAAQTGSRKKNTPAARFYYGKTTKEASLVIFKRVLRSFAGKMRFYAWPMPTWSGK